MLQTHFRKNYIAILSASEFKNLEVEIIAF